MAQIAIRKITDRPNSRPIVLNLFFDSPTGIYTSSNAEYLPNVTRPIDGLSSVFEGLKTRWAYDDYFYCAMVPVQVNYDLPMLDCLSPAAMNVRKVVNTTGEVYRMDESLCREWIDLERAIVELQRRLLARYLLPIVFPLHRRHILPSLQKVPPKPLLRASATFGALSRRGMMSLHDMALV